MNQIPNPITLRIRWCRQQATQAQTEWEADGWRAEEEGLRDALMNSDHTDDYRLYPPEICERYVNGFQDGTVMLRAARVEHMTMTAAAVGLHPADRMGRDLQWSEDQ